MKQKTRIKIAYDMCISKKFSYLMSVILLAVTLFMIGVIVYQYKVSFSYRMRVQEGFLTSINDIYYCQTSGNGTREEIAEILSEINGISSIYNYGKYTNSLECLSFLNEIQEEHKSYNTADLEVYALKSKDFDIYNIHLTEGVAPKDIEWINETMVPLYLSEKYKSITNLGEHYYAYSIDGERLIYDYFVAGYFSEDSAIVGDRVLSDYDKSGSDSLKYGIIELVSFFYVTDGYFALQDGYTSLDVAKDIQRKLEKIDSSCTIGNLSHYISFTEKNTVRNLKYLLIATILLIGTSIIVLLVTQVGNVLTRSDEFGIWLVNKATQKDIVWILLWQSIVRLFFAVLTAFLVFNLLNSTILFENNFDNSIIAHRISRRIIFLYVYPSMAVMGIIILILANSIPLIKLAKSEPVKLIKGDM